MKDHTSKGQLSGKAISHAHIEALVAKYKGNEKADGMIVFAGLMEQAKAIHALMRDHPAQPLVKETFSALGAFALARLGWDVEEFKPIAREFQAALAADMADTFQLRQEEDKADAIERSLREGQGSTETHDALARASRKTLN